MYMNKELTYCYIADKITENCTSNLEITKTINSYAYLNEEQNSPFIYPCDNNVSFDLITGLGWCDQKSNAVVHLLEKKNIDANLVMFPCHTVTEVSNNGHSELFDPTFNCFFLSKDSLKIANVEDVLNKHNGLQMNDGRDFDDYNGKHILSCGPYQKWKRLSNNKSFIKKNVSNIVGFYYWLEGDFFVSIFEKCFLTYIEKIHNGDVLNSNARKNKGFMSEYDNKDFYLFYKARSLSLLGKHCDAFKLCKQLEKNTAYYDEAVFFEAKLLLKSRKFSDFHKLYSAVISTYSDRMIAYEIDWIFLIN